MLDPTFDRHDELPLSTAQRAMWFVQQLAPGSSAYHGLFAARVRAPLEAGRLTSAARALAERHELLRATFHAAGGDPMQRVHATVVPEVRVRALGPGDPSPHQLARAEIARPFDLERAPAWRLAIFSSAQDDHLLVLTIHHLIIDLATVVPLIDDLLALYQEGDDAALPALRGGFADYVRWERDLLASPEGDRLRAQWREALAGDLPALDLPLDFPRPPQQTYDGSSVAVPLPAGLRPRVRELATACGVTPFAVLLAAYQALLGRWCGQESFVVGTPVPGRRGLPQLDGTIGNFVNMLPMRADLAGDPSFAELVRGVGEAVRAARARQEIPLPVIVQDVVRHRDPSRPPLFQTLFSLQRTSLPELAPFFVTTDRPLRITLRGLALEPSGLSQQEGQLELSLELVELGDDYCGELKFNTALLAPQTATALAAAYATLLASAVAAPAQPLSQLPLLSETGRARALAAAGGAPGELVAEDPRGFVEHFVAQLADCPDAVAISMGDRRWSYRELGARAAELSHRLRARQVTRDAIVAIDLPRGPEWIAAMVAVSWSGAAFLALDPDHPPSRIAQLLVAAGAVGVVTTAERRAACAALLQTAGMPPAWLEVLEDPPGPALGTAPRSAPELAPPRPGDLAYVIFTSGSTGTPKGALVEHGGMHNHLRAKLAALGIGATDVIAQTAPASFVIANWQALAGLEVGAAIEVIEREVASDPRALLTRVEAAGVTVLQLVPSLLRALLEVLEALPATARPRLSRLRWLVPTGEALPMDLCHRWSALYPQVPLLNAYGCSECSDDVAHHLVARSGAAPEAARAATTIAPLGRPVAGVRLYVLDPQLEPVPDGAIGELWVSGVAVGRGYINDEARTAHAFRRDPFVAVPARMYRTGDRARRRHDGVLEYHGRTDHQIKVRGVRVELGEIEAALGAHPQVRQAAVTVERDAHQDTRLVAHVVARGPGLDRDTLHQHVVRSLPAGLAPSAYWFVDDLPVNAHGKLDRRALAARAPQAPPAPLAAGREAGARDGDREAGGLDGDVAMAELRQLWRDLLGVATLGDHDDFFARGGHSLLAVRLLVRVRERFGVEIPLSAVFELSTVAAMAQAIRRAAPAPAADAEAGFHGDLAAALEPFPLTDLQQAYWIGQSDDQGGGAAVAFLEHDLCDVAPEAFATALDALIARHPMLRAVIRADGLQQVLAAPGRFPLEVIDLRSRAEPARDRTLAEGRAALSNFLVEPERWPAMRLRLYRLDARRLRLHLGFPLLLGDLQSFRVISRELGELVHHPERPLPELGVSYRDCVLHLRDRGAHPEVRRAEAYWRARLDTLPAAPELPLAAAPPRAGAPLRRFAGVLPTAAWRRIRVRAQALGLTPTAVIATLYAEVLARFSTTATFTLNLLVQRRPAVHPQIDDVVGNFSSTVLLAVDLREPVGFAARARAVQTQLWRDLDHGQVSGVQVVRELARARRDGRATAMPVVLASTLHLEAEQLDTTDLLGPPLSDGLRTPHVWIDHQVAQTHAGLRYHWDMLEGRFPPGLDEAMFRCYEQALAALAGAEDADDPAAPEQAWSRSTVALPTAELVARTQANQTETAQADGLLHDPVFARAAAHPEAPAIITAERVIGYSELAARAAQVAQQLRDDGVAPGELVAVVMHKGWEQIVAVLGVLAAGAAYLPIDAGLPPERRALLLRLGRARVLLTQAALAARQPEAPGLQVLVVAAQPPPIPPRALPPRARPSDLAYVIFTSGSTGEPKGVMVDHRGAANTVRDINRRFAIGPRDRVLGVSSLSFDLSVYDVFGVLAAGGALVLPTAERALDPAHWLRLITGEHVTLWNSVPQLLQLLVEHAAQQGAELAPLRLALVSGDWVPLDLAAGLTARAPGALAVSLGGATEASIWSIAHPITAVDPSWASIPYGRPLANQRFHVLDDQLEPRPVWVPGELYIAGAGLALGYWADEVRTRERFFAHPRTGERLYRTGDLGRYLPDGELEFLGRLDAQVKVNGYRVELGEIEAQLARLPGVRAAAVAAHGPARGPRRLVAYVVSDPAPGDAALGGPVAELEPARAALLRARLAEHLPDYMIPLAFFAIARLPLTGNGKLDRKALPAPSALTAERPRVMAPPRDALEAALAALWCQLLEVPQVGIDDDFFTALGGNSFAAVRLLARVTALHGPALSLGDFARTPTVAAQAAAIRSQRGPAVWSPLVPLRAGAAPPLFLIHPIGGGVLCYRGLAEALRGRAVLGLQARGLEQGVPSSSIAEMAEGYADAIAAEAPRGPLRLGGWSMGGLVAHEVARRLEARGRQVDGLVLLDPATPGDVAPVSAGALRAWFLRDLARSGELAAPGPLAGSPPPRSRDDGHAPLSELLAAAQASGSLSRAIVPADLEAPFAVFAAHQTAMERHQPQPVRAPALLIVAADGDRGRPEVWRALAGAVHQHTQAGDHYALLASEHLPTLAAAIEGFFADVGVAPGAAR